jgi:hypothetical protein
MKLWGQSCTTILRYVHLFARANTPSSRTLHHALYNVSKKPFARSTTTLLFGKLPATP